MYFFYSEIVWQTFYVTIKIIFLDKIICLVSVLSCLVSWIWKLCLLDVWERGWGSSAANSWFTGALSCCPCEVVDECSERHRAAFPFSVWRCFGALQRFEGLRKMYCRNWSCGQTVRREFQLIRTQDLVWSQELCLSLLPLFEGCIITGILWRWFSSCIDSCVESASIFLAQG